MLRAGRRGERPHGPGGDDAGQRENASRLFFTAPIRPIPLDAASPGKILDKIHTFPVATNIVEYPRCGRQGVQVEPEMAVFVDVQYAEPDSTARGNLSCPGGRRFNDSIRARGLGSQRGKRGAESKGISSRVIDSFAPGTLVDRLVMVSYVMRDGVVEKYSRDAPARNYMMFHEPLLAWIVDRINNQRNEDKWDDVGELVRAAGYPPHAWIALGAGTYTAWGEKNYLRPRDEAVVIVYDDAKFPNGPDAAQWRRCSTTRQPRTASCASTKPSCDDEFDDELYNCFSRFVSRPASSKRIVVPRVSSRPDVADVPPSLVMAMSISVARFASIPSTWAANASRAPRAHPWPCSRRRRTRRP